MSVNARWEAIALLRQLRACSFAFAERELMEGNAKIVSV